jgi:hypothetical protein
VVPQKSLLARVMYAVALACIAVAGCGRSSNTIRADSQASSARNEVCDSELRSAASCWTLGGSMTVRQWLGPNNANIVYYAGTGRSSGFQNDASFLARVQPGQTYTFSAYVDGTGAQDVPPYILLAPVNGSWTGASVMQAGKGRVSTAFTIPADSNTTMIRGSFATENGMYPLGRGAIMSQPQVEQGSSESAYAPSDDAAWTVQPPGGNLIGEPDATDAHRWILQGGMARVRNLLGDGSIAMVYRGDGSPSGFGTTATTRAPVTAGATYTLTAYVDGSASRGTPPYIWILARNGSWPGVHMFQPDRGFTMMSFTVPRDSSTSCVEIEFSSQNGVYPPGTSLVFAHPQLTEGTTVYPFDGSAASRTNAPPGAASPACS